MGWTKSCPWNLRLSGLQLDWLGCCFEKVWCTLISRKTVDVLSQCRPVRRSHEKKPYLCGRWNRNICVEPKSQSERARVPGTWHKSHGIYHSFDLQISNALKTWSESVLSNRCAPLDWVLNVFQRFRILEVLCQQSIWFIGVWVTTTTTLTSAPKVCGASNLVLQWYLLVRVVNPACATRFSLFG
jgi:hypothetical protein